MEKVSPAENMLVTWRPVGAQWWFECRHVSREGEVIGEVDFYVEQLVEPCG